MPTPPHHDFYHQLQTTLHTVRTTGTLRLDFQRPLSAPQVDSLIYRVSRNRRGQAITRVEIHCCRLSHKRASVPALARFLSSLERCVEFCFEEKDHRGWQGNLTSVDVGTLVQACPNLETLFLDSGLERHDRPDLCLNVQNPLRLQELDIEFVGDDGVQGFAQNLSALRKLDVLKVGLLDANSEAYRTLFRHVRDLTQLRAFRMRSWGQLELQRNAMEELCAVLREGQIKFLHLHSISGCLLSNRHNARLFAQALKVCESVEEFYVAGDLGLQEETVIDLFEALAHNKTMASVIVDQKHLTMSEEGWTSILASLAVNNSMTRVCLSANGEDEVLVKTIVKGLKQNTAITHFALRCEDSQVCSCNHSGLRALASRNVGLNLTQNMKSSKMTPSLLPRALTKLMEVAAGDASCAFLTVRTFSDHLLQEPPSPKGATNNMKKRCGMKRSACQWSNESPAPLRSMRRGKRHRMARIGL